MIEIIILFLVSVAGLASAALCKSSHENIHGYFYKYCSQGCCHYHSYDPCCYYYDIHEFHSSLSLGAVFGIVISVIVLMLIVISVIVFCVCGDNRAHSSKEKIFTPLQPMSSMVTTTGVTGNCEKMNYGQSNGGFDS